MSGLKRARGGAGRTYRSAESITPFFYLIARCNFSPRFSARFREVCISQPDIRNVRVNHWKPLLAQAMKNFSRPSIDTPPLPPPPKRTIFGEKHREKTVWQPSTFWLWTFLVLLCVLLLALRSFVFSLLGTQSRQEHHRNETPENWKHSESPRKFVYRVKSRNWISTN